MKRTIQFRNVVTNSNIADGVHGPRLGLEDVSFYPDLVAELLRRNWTDKDVKAALGGNFLRVFEQVEKIKSNSPGADEPIPYEQVQNECRTGYGYQNNGTPLVLFPPVISLACLAYYILV
ncbi:hypothetical protein chiPu_0006149 [Chiloscyllium punctatum]|uniref:Dipeptidase n=1 Tax=Chiloscyllium punctatum TaxID=137246 RepID=A0A401SBI6_CHIPU|nr:hypothetical protein [Chiloscyllium punctatum]